MSNKKKGNRFEEEFCELLFEKGYWAHNLAQNKSGQPADVIAVKGDQAVLVDCKVVSTARGFQVDRVEDNQHLAMVLWKVRTGHDGWFAIKYEAQNEIYMLSYNTIEYLGISQSYITYPDAIVYGTLFEDWINGSINWKFNNDN